MKMDNPSFQQTPDLLSDIDVLRTRITSTTEVQIKLFLDGFDGVAAELFRQAPIPGARLHGQDLTGLDFTGADLTGADFSDALITGARFDTARVTQSQLRKARDWKDHVKGWTLSRRPLSTSLHAGDCFSIAPFAPELVLLPDELARHSERPIGVAPVEWAALAEGRLAMAQMPVSVSQFGFHRAALGGGNWSDSDAYIPMEMSVRNARDYLSWVRRRSAADFRVPSHGLLAFIARKGRHDEDELAAITTESMIGLREPARIDPAAQRGEGRCNCFGLHDIFGNTREFVDIADKGRRIEDGFEARFASVGGCFRETREEAFNLQKHRSLDVTAREHGLRLVLLLSKQEQTGQ